jgi:hypothetical protein
MTKKPSERPGRRKFFRRGIGMAATGVVAACSTNKETSDLAGPSPVAGGDRLITVRSIGEGTDEFFPGLRFGVGEPPTAYVTNESGTALISVGGATMLQFGWPNGGCLPFRTDARDDTEFFVHTPGMPYNFLQEVTGGVEKRTTKSGGWHVALSDELWPYEESFREVIQHVNALFSGLCTVSLGRSIPRDVALLECTVDRTIDANRYGAITNIQRSGDAILGALARFAKPEYSVPQLIFHEFGHALLDLKHVYGHSSIMNDTRNIYTFVVSSDRLLNAAMRGVQHRRPGTRVVDGREDTLGIPVSAAGAVAIWEECPPCRAPFM